MKTFSRLARLCTAASFVTISALSSPRLAYAAGATLTVNSNSDADVNGDSKCTLREAISAANNNADYNECTSSGYGNDLIQFSISGSTKITLGSPLPTVSSAGTLTINGSNGGAPVVIDGAGSHQIFHVAGTLTLGGLTLQHAAADPGGAIFNNTGAHLIVLNSTFRNNVETGTAGGGAILNWGSATIANSTFYGNKATYGGAVGSNSATLSIYNSTFSSNIATTDQGALSVWKGGTPPSITYVYNTILGNSSAPSDCGADGLGTLSGSNNIVETGSSCSAITSSTADPKLGSATGSPAYFPLLTGSPAIDKGNNTKCAGAPVNNLSQNRIPRPQDGNNDSSAVCDIGSFEKPMTKTFVSTASLDGWVLESSETSNLGGSMDASSLTVRLGDDGSDRQFRSILSFNTSGLPDSAVIMGVTLKVKKQGIAGGGDPVTIFQGFVAAVRKGFFGSASSLQTADFAAYANKTLLPVSPSLISGGYSISLTSAKAYVNKLSTNGGVTQIRLRFKLDDNDNLAANYLSLYSGNSSTTTYRPQLLVTYYVP